MLSAGLPRHRPIIALAFALWIPAVGFGLNVLWRYSTTPGRAASAPLEWPSGAPIRRAPGRPTLLMFVHPHCQCSRASIGELAILTARAPGKLDTHVFFYLPSGEASEWGKTDLWQSAQIIPGVRAAEDREGAVAGSFGTFTSGQTLLYNAEGRLMFQGGITAARGHSGDNSGRDALLALLQQPPPRNVSPVAGRVFGCSLRGG